MSTQPNALNTSNLPVAMMLYPSWTAGRADIVRDVDANGLRILRIKICRTCQSSLKNCVCGNPVPGDQPLPIIWRAGLGENKRLMNYLSSKKKPTVVAAMPAPDVEVKPEPVKQDTADVSPTSPGPVLLPKPEPDLAEIKRAMSVLIAKGSKRVIELRAFGTSKCTWSGYYSNPSALAKDTHDLSAREDVPNVYWTLQEIESTLLARRENKAECPVKVTTADANAIRYLYLPFDFDPCRVPKDSSNNDEKARALELATSFRAFLAERGIFAILADSGNGYHLLARIDMPVSRESTALVSAILTAATKRFSTCLCGKDDPPCGKIKIDESIYNPSRILKAYGTVARKGSHTAERPWRLSKILDVPENMIVATEESLRALLTALGGEVSATGAVAKPVSDADVWEGPTPEMIEEELARLGIGHRARIAYKDGFKWQFAECVFHAHHESPDSFLALERTGLRYFSCSHPTCEGHRGGKEGWKEFKKKVSGFDFERPVSPAPVATSDGVERSSTGVPIRDVPEGEDDPFEMTGDTFDTKIYDVLATKSVPYPDPGEGDLVSFTAHRLVSGSSIDLGYCREPLKAIVNHIIDGYVIHPAYPHLTLRGNYFSLGESDGGKTTGFKFVLDTMKPLLTEFSILSKSLFFYKSEQAFVQGLSARGTLKETKRGKETIVTGHPGNPNQFLYVTEGNQVATSAETFRGVFSLLTDLYDQQDAGSGSLTNGEFTAKDVKISAIMCFTPADFTSTFKGKGTIGAGGVNRWGMVCPPMNHDYDEKDWVDRRLLARSITEAINLLSDRCREIAKNGTGVRELTEEAGAKKIRLAVKRMVKEAGPVGKRLMDYFVREQVNQAAMSLNNPYTMTEAQARYIERWVETQIQCRLDNWPSDSGNLVEGMEHAQRKAVKKCHTSETVLKDACHYYREGTGGIWTFNTAVKNNLLAGGYKHTGLTRKGVRTFCPGSCVKHPAIEPPKKGKSKD